MSAEYWREYRKKNKEKVNAKERARRAVNRVRGDRSAEYARRKSRAVEKLPILYPELNHGTAYSFWEDELRMDLAQEAVLAKLEKCKDIPQRLADYKKRENDWFHFAAPLVADADDFFEEVAA